MSFLIPENLESERLVLRMFRETDYKDLHEYYGYANCTRYTSGRPLADHESWQKLAALIGHWHLRRYGSYALEEKSTGKVIGLAGLDYPYDWPEPEIQWGLSFAYWGKGYASEAVRAAKATGAFFEKEILFRNDDWHIYRH